jgi:hypothetical protein
MIGPRLVASWRHGEHAGTRLVPTVSVWAATDATWPTVGAKPGATQIAWAECARGSMPPHARRARVATFSIVSGADTASFLAAVWRAPRGGFVQLLASATRASDLDPVRRALRDVVIDPPESR